MNPKTTRLQSAHNIDITQWLKDNKLVDIEQRCLEKEMIIEELLEFNEVELNQLCKDMGFDTLQKKRFVKAIQKLQLQSSFKSYVDVKSNDANIINIIQQSSNQNIDISSKNEDNTIKIWEQYDKNVKSMTTQLNYLFQNVEKDMKSSFEKIDIMFQSKDNIKIVKNNEMAILLKFQHEEYSKLLAKGKEQLEMMINNQIKLINNQKNTVVDSFDNLNNKTNSNICVIDEKNNTNKQKKLKKKIL